MERGGYIVNIQFDNSAFSSRYHRIVIAFAVITLIMLLTTGCTVYSTIQSNYQPTVDPDLSHLAPVIVRLQVTDNRPAGERDNIGRMNKRVYLLDKEPTTALFDAIKAGLEENGHRVQDKDNTSADIVLNVDLNRFFWAVKGEGLVSIVTTATVQADVYAQNITGEPKDNRFSISGTGQMKFILVGAGGEEKIINEAMTGAVDQLLGDSRLLEVVKRSQGISERVRAM
jgi:hypothetical protein